MICTNCEKTFNQSTIECNEPHDRGDGVMYGSCSYSANYICPYCGHDNSPRTFMGGNKQ